MRVNRQNDICANALPLDKRSVTLGQRIEERRRALGISQAELARRVGVRQSTMNSLINGDSRSSRSIVDIARELRTSTAYLLGKVNDPTLDAPVPPDLPMQDRRLVAAAESLKGAERSFLLEMLEAVHQSRTTEPAPMELPSEDALADMFEGLLLAIDRTQPLASVSRELAQLLPTGLSRLQGRLIALPRAPRHERSQALEAFEAPATEDHEHPQ